MHKLLFLLFLFTTLSSSAQIGYQVSLLNNATGEARANERVNMTVKITDSEGKTVCEETKSETSNDFGVISMSVGDSETFANADWSKLPFFIEATVDGRLLGRSQLLSVPVAEYAKRTGMLTKEFLCSKEWIQSSDDNPYFICFKFDIAGNLIRTSKDDDGTTTYSGSYFLDGNDVVIYYINKYGDVYNFIAKYIPQVNALFGADGGIWK